MKILIVDDDATLRANLARAISTEPGHQITQADDGLVAWALLNDPARYFDVAFIDINMPGIDGIELARRIRQSEILQSLEIILCSACSDRVTIAAAIKAGVKHYILKPWTKEAVFAKLRTIKPTAPSDVSRNLMGV